jgi:superfamily II DNA or RNA helicase
MSKKTLFPTEPKTVTSISSIKDNRGHGKVGEFLKEVMAEGCKVSIVSAYFTVNAYQQLREELDSIESLRFLFGDPAYLRVKDEDKGQKNYQLTDEGLVMAAQMQQRTMAKACAEWLEKKAEIRSLVRPNFLHGKLYHIANTNRTEEAITGSSNFTSQGLGFGAMPNMELNIVINDRRDKEELKSWFEELWNDDTGLVEDVKGRVLEDLRALYADTPPEFVYFKTLYHVFEKFLNDQSKGGLLDERTGFFDSEVWDKLYAFQKDGVKGAINKILTHGGCIIADSVGLGKTFEALAVIKYFELLNKNVLVLCPKKLAPNWTVYQAKQNSTLNPFPKDRFQYAVMCHSDLGRKGGVSAPNGINLDDLNWGAYDLIVIDESHNFKGNPISRELEDGTMKINRAHFLLERIIKAGVKTKVLLLSATPVNNNLRDLRNQINVIAAGDDRALFESTGISEIGETLRLAQVQFTNWADPNKNPDRSVKQLLERLDSSFFKLLDELTIARSRKHVTRYYDSKDVGEFPKREKPVSIYPHIDLEDRFPSYDTLNKKIQAYTLAIYNPSAFLREGAKAKYEVLAGKQIAAFTQERREHFLIGMMKVNFLKRLESSVNSFQVSMDRTVKKIDAVLERIEKYEQRPEPQVKIAFDDIEPPESERDETGEDEEGWTVGKKEYELADIKLNEWKEALVKDREQLNELFLLARGVDPKHDAKLFELKKLIVDKVLKPYNGDNKKVLVFTAFSDTAKYIYENLLDFAKHEVKLNIALVTGSETKTTFGHNDFNSILTNFSPRSKERSKRENMKQDGQVDLLIASDCISEGQNLQDCDFLVNYDIHWNPVRIIQRFGRIDRLGSINKSIRLVNFWPTEDLDSYINLKTRVEARMALVDVTATGEDNPLGNDQIEDLVTEDLKYRDRQLKKLKDEVLDLENMGENISLTDLTLDDFRTELLNFLKGNEDKLKNAPLGLYAVVPSSQHKLGAKQYSATENTGLRDLIKPGVILCLKQRGAGEHGESVNPLQPYFLVYVRDDGTVRFNYVQAKQTLDLFRLLCTGRTEAWSELCRLFDTETNGGADMGRYHELMQQAAKEIARLFRKRGGQRLAQDRGALLIPEVQHVSTPDDFDLVTWLVIK